MKIVKLEAENIKRLVAIEIRPDGNMVEITGRNGSGKTSCLDAIAWAIEGAKDIQAAPIRRGWDRARIKLDLGELVVTRTFIAKDNGGYTTSLTVTNADGAKYPSPQTMLDKLLGSLSFDPLAFSRMKPKEQFDALRQFVPDVDFDAIDMANKADYASRADANKRAKELRAQAAGITLPADMPERVDESELVDQLEAAGKHNAEVEAAKTALANTARAIDTHKATAAAALDRATSYRKMAEEQEAQATAAQERADTLQRQLEATGQPSAPIDTSPIRAMIADARTIAGYYEKHEKKSALLASAEEAEAAASAFTQTMAKREADKRAAIAAAKLPIPGIGFGDGCILLDDVPFDQASDAEQLRASVALAMAQNPKLRVIRVRDGSLLDEASLRLVAEMADENDCQVWVERVDTSGAVGFVIEDGCVLGGRDGGTYTRRIEKHAKHSAG